MDNAIQEESLIETKNSSNKGEKHGQNSDRLRQMHWRHGQDMRGDMSLLNFSR